MATNPSLQTTPTATHLRIPSVGLPPPNINLPELLGVIAPGLCCNMDETQIPFEFLDNKTYSKKGVHTVQLKSRRSGWDERQATLMLTIFADGIGRVKPVLIFHGKSDANRTRERNARQQRLFEAEQARYHPGVVVIFNEEAYNNEEVMISWLKTQLFPETVAAMGFTDDLATFERQPESYYTVTYE